MKNKDRLEKEWEALCAYQAEPNASTVGMKDGNAKKNRSTAVVACESLLLLLLTSGFVNSSRKFEVGGATNTLVMDRNEDPSCWIRRSRPAPSRTPTTTRMKSDITELSGCVEAQLGGHALRSGKKGKFDYFSSLSIMIIIAVVQE